MCSGKFKILIIFTVVLLSSVCFAEDKVIVDLKGCIERAVKFHPELGEYKQDIEIYKAKLSEAQAAVFPQIELMALAGPSPEARKEAISPEIRTDVKSTTINGVFGMITMQLLQPIYTFGKISGYKKAAQGGIKVSEAELEKKRSEIILKTKELYWSLSMIRDLRMLANEIKDELEKAIKRTEEDLKKDIPSTDELTLYKLKTYLGEVKRNLNEIDKNEAIIIEALKFMTGTPQNTKLEIITEPLKYEEAYIRPDELIAKAFQLRPEMIQIKEGLKAKQALVDVEKSNFYPQIFFLIKGSLAGATNRDRIHNPYISDPLNDSMLAAVVGMKLNIDFGITKGKVREARIEYQKILEKKKLAEQGIPVQIMKAYYELEEATKSARDMEDAYQNAKKWLITAQANLDMGLGETKDLADAVLAYATTRVNHLKALYNQKMAIANLLQASGLDREREVK
ncbi:TolC family protein [Thermodesulfovibrio sp.]|jgi:outer membrane protein TolC|uniref:TolC family protein n=1 Tax=Thermodesulfovibrio sp. TaxID=2067987 RepID=UPI003D0C1CF3